MMHRFSLAIALISIMIAFSYPASSKTKSSAKAAFPEFSTSKISDMPDLTQTDKRGNLPGKGRSYCGPVAVSNSLVWLARHGYPNLAPGYNGTIQSQASIAKVLGLKYMKTNSKGTNTTRVIQGVRRYVQDRGYRIAYLGYSGWHWVPSNYFTGQKRPSLAFIKRGALGRSAGWINLGWYKYDPVRRTYKRVRGHWVTLAGYGVDSNGKKSPDTILMHDPASRNGRKMATNYVKLRLLNGGTMFNNSGKRTVNAKGFYAIKSGLVINKKADIGIIDGVVLMTM